MSTLSRLGAQARYNVLTPVFLLSLGLAAPALADNQDWVITTPQTNFILLENDALTNHSIITGMGGNPAVHGEGNVRFITNTVDGQIDSTTRGIYIEGNVGQIINAGGILAVSEAIRVDGDVGSIINTGDITAVDQNAVHIEGDVDTFRNSGLIGSTEIAVYINGDVGSFINSGAIDSLEVTGVLLGSVDYFLNEGAITAETDAIFIADTANHFINRGFILSADDVAIEIDDVGRFENSGSIVAELDGVHINRTVGSFRNSGSIFSNDDEGVYVGLTTGSFENSGQISGDDEGVHLVGDVGEFTNSGTILGDQGVIFGAEVTRFENSGFIAGDYEGVLAVGFVESFDNSGTITSASAVGVSFLENAGVVRNNGIITGYESGMLIQAVEGLINNGIIGGQNAVGLYVDDGIGLLRNTAIIASVNSEAIYVDGDVLSFENVSGGGIFTNSTEYAAVFVAGTVDKFVNSGQISGGYGVNINEDVGSFENLATGAISGDNTGVFLGGSVTSFINHGSISGGDNVAAYFDDVVGSVLNTGSVGSDQEAFHFSDDVTSFENSGTISSDYIGAYFLESVDQFSNSGLISGADFGIYVTGTAETVINTGTIVGASGVVFDSDGSYLRNSGTIAATNQYAVVFSGDDNILDIRSGARFVGDVDFGSGANTYLEASAYHGSIVIGDEGATLNAGNVRPGTNYYYQDPNFIYIVSDDFVRRAALPVASLAGGVADVLTRQLSLGDAISNPDDLTMNYAASPRSAAETATLAAIETGEDRLHVWSEALGGFGGDQASETAEGYAGLVAGAHREVAAGLTLGAFAGAGHTRLDVANGAHVINGTVALAGVYGKYDAGIIRTDFSLIAGLSGNDSVRETAETEGPFVTTASYGGWFIAPTAGAYLPVLSSDSSEITIGGRLGYVAGGFGDYFEEGSTGGLYVGAQSYGILTALAEIKGETRVQDGLTLQGSAGVFARNHTGSDVEVFLPIADASMGISTAGTGAGLGVKAAIGAEMTVSDALTLTAGVNASWASNSGAVAAANLGLGGKF